MAELPIRNPEVAKEFKNGKCIVHKGRRVFSSIPIDQAHEQNNALIKEDGGAVGLTDNQSVLQRWMVAGPEVARVVEQFLKKPNHCSCKTIDTLP